ncbi:MAG: hypothetical protein KQJ78_25685, partial [Deltaproteobacteria bacterium]|nr:hypothetical protein [Deltaproteobacteria bacterium]
MARSKTIPKKSSKENRRHGINRLLFDKRDHQLIDIVNDVLRRDRTRHYTRKLVYPYLHPRGIKEMSESKGLRIAFAVIHLLKSLEGGQVDERLNALRSLRDEIVNTAAGSLHKNGARVLIQIMKELVRAHGDYILQLQLAHDFRTAVAGNPRIIRRQLKKYHLLEMPEEWNQISFDDHVHDANTKGRKSSSHLIMDAWIKGIRRLRVIYYNYLEPKFAVELLEAARIMEMDLRIGIEFYARFRNKSAQIIWTPRGFADSQDFLCFLAEENVAAFMAEGKKVPQYQKEFVLTVLDDFNREQYPSLRDQYHLEMPELNKKEFLSFVGAGQASLLHLADYIHGRMLPAMKSRVEFLSSSYAGANWREREKMEREVAELNRLDSEKIYRHYLKMDGRNEIAPVFTRKEDVETPELLKITPRELIGRLSQFRAAYRITLNLTDLQVEDVIELLYLCEGAITRLEIFNLKDYAEGKTENITDINELQQAINQGNVIHLKRIIRKTIEKIGTSGQADQADRVHALEDILHDIATFRDFYKRTPLKARIGSDSTGRSPRIHGMGLAVKGTLPLRANREIKKMAGKSRDIIPVRLPALKRVTFSPRTGFSRSWNSLYRFCRRIPYLGNLFGRVRLTDWLVLESETRLDSRGNVVTLGGVQKFPDNGLRLQQTDKKKQPRLSWKYLNTGVKNGLKVFIGFVPAFATFYLTKDWWVLSWLGAFIWFGITGLRNILQSVLGGGGVKRSPLLRWNDYVRWERLTDSLLYTGFSVPLLDYAAKTLILQHGFNITTATNPVALYAFMGLTNGVYLFSHNLFRGLQKGAAFANLFRSILSIPVAVGLNAVAGGMLGAAGVAGVDDILQKWAAIISKGASDLVAGIIEGVADRYQNIRMRVRDYQTKIAQIFDVYARLELIFPKINTMDLLNSPEQLDSATRGEVRDLDNIMIINALDLLYFWMYQPRARSALKLLMGGLTDEEKEILKASQ